MRPDGEGRFCERCELHVTDVASLDADGLDSLLAKGGRVCARFELERGQPRTKLGIAAGVMVMALAGCATPALSETPREPEFASFIATELGEDTSGGLISGVVRSTWGGPLSNALVVLRRSPLETPQEQLTNEQGFYAFKQLPPGTYTIQVFYDEAVVIEVTALPQDARSRVDISMAPDGDGLMLGMIVE
jgi:hypothetical protein